MVRAEIWLQDNLESQRGIDDLASRLGYSTSQVRRKFKHHFGLTPSAYRDVLRLEKAINLLTLTPFSIAEIARRCGYGNHSAFSRAFLRHHGQSPRHFRQVQRMKLRAQCHSGDPPPFKVRHFSPRQALVTRVYETPPRETDLARWATHTSGAETLPRQVKKAPAVALMYGLPLPSVVERIDLGLVITPGTASTIAIPPNYRLLKLPAARHACMVVESFDELTPAVRQLLGRGLPSRKLHANGDAAQVYCHPHGLELQLPLLEASEVAKSIEAE